jgi:hypothetical protein
MRIVGWTCVAYGCFGMVVCMWWLASALTTGMPILPTASQTVLLAAPFALAMVLTFHRRIESTPLPPLIVVTEARSRGALWALRLASGNALFWLAVAKIGPNQFVTVATLETALTSIFILGLLYLVLHWTLRPENFLPPWVIAITFRHAQDALRARERRSQRLSRTDRQE